MINEASVYDVSINSPTTYATNLSMKEGNEIYLKREDLQPIFSFKNRGAFNKIVNLSEDKKSIIETINTEIEDLKEINNKISIIDSKIASQSGNLYVVNSTKGYFEGHATFE